MSGADAVAVVAGGPAGEVFELAREMALRGKAEVGADGGDGFVGVGEEVFCLLYLFAHDVVREVLARLLFEPCGEAGTAHIHCGGDVLMRLYGDKRERKLHGSKERRNHPLSYPNRDARLNRKILYLPTLFADKRKSKQNPVRFCLLMVELRGFEPLTPCLPDKYSSQLS